jgi:hypothetical protein
MDLDSDLAYECPVAVWLYKSVTTQREGLIVWQNSKTRRFRTTKTTWSAAQKLIPTCAWWFTGEFVDNGGPTELVAYLAANMHSFVTACVRDGRLTMFFRCALGGSKMYSVQLPLNFSVEGQQTAATYINEEFATDRQAWLNKIRPLMPS